MKTPRKLTALVLMGAMAATSVCAIPASAQTFSDVPSNHWAYKVISEISDQKVMVGWGNGIFAPESTLTRAEYTGILYNLAPDKASGDYETNLSDVDPARWYAKAAEWGVSNGIISEIDGQFRPNEPASRELMANMTYMFIFWYYPATIDFREYGDAGYADQDQINSTYKHAINVLTNNGLLAGRGNDMFEPQGTLTRAEAAAMASRLIALAGEPDDPTEDPDDPEQPPVEDPDENQPVDPGDDPSEEPETPPAEDPSDKPTEDPDKPSVDDPDEEKPSDPGNEDPDEEQPKWEMDGAPDWFLVGKPDSISQEVWDQLITYYADKERPVESNFPSKLPSQFADDEEAAKNYIAPRLEWLYDLMQEDLNEQAWDVDGISSLSTEEKTMVTMVNNARRAAGVPELKVSKALCEAADIRAKEALTSDPHKRPTGEDADTVLSEVGLIHYSQFAENQTVRPTDKAFPAEDAISNFLNSPDHKKIMLNDRSEYIGVGFYSNGEKSAWIQIFGRAQEGY